MYITVQLCLCELLRSNVISTTDRLQVCALYPHGNRRLCLLIHRACISLVQLVEQDYITAVTYTLCSIHSKALVFP
jgi:hypothetical protein